MEDNQPHLESKTPQQSLISSLDPADGNFVSRKFLFAVGTSVLIFIAGMVAGVKENYGQMIYGLLGVLGLYTGSNVGSRYVTGKHIVALSQNQDSDDSDTVTRINR